MKLLFYSISKIKMNNLEYKNKDSEIENVLDDTKTDIENLEKKVKAQIEYWINKISKNIISALSAVLLLTSEPAHAWWINFHINYGTNYYERYNPYLKNLENVEALKPTVRFNIYGGLLKWDGITYRLSKVEEIFSKNLLKEYDLETVVVKINGKEYKAKPHFKKLIFTQHWKKWGFWYTVWKELILVYIPYKDRIKIIWTISQWQFIEENTYKEYDISVKNEVRKKVLLKIFALLWCRDFKNCSVKSNISWNNYFYNNWKLIGVLQNLWNEKILTRKNWNKHIDSYYKNVLK